MTILAKRMTFAIIIAGIMFILFPTQAGFSRQDPTGSFQWFYSILYILDKEHNLFPSLHIILSTLVVIAIYRNVNNLLKIIYPLWLLALYISVLLVHQHHIPDIIAGLILTYVCAWRIPRQESQALR